MDRIGALIPVRMDSERLPGKALKIIMGKPIVIHLLDRVACSRYIQKENIVVCTTTDRSDDPLVSAIKDYGASVFRGSRDDIIRRFHDAVVSFEFDAVSQVDGDDPLCDRNYMDMTMEALLKDRSLDVVSTNGLPLGMNSKSFSRHAMEEVFNHYRTEMNDTGFGEFFTQTGLCRHKIIQPLTEMHKLDQARLTLDYNEDFEVLEKIFEALHVEGEVFGLDAILTFLRANPEVMEINRGINQQYWRRHKKKAQLYYQDEDGMIRKIERS